MQRYFRADINAGYFIKFTAAAIGARAAATATGHVIVAVASGVRCSSRSMVAVALSIESRLNATLVLALWQLFNHRCVTLLLQDTAHGSHPSLELFRRASTHS